MMINHFYPIVKIRTSQKATPFRYEHGGPRYVNVKGYILKVIDKLLADAAG